MPPSSKAPAPVLTIAGPLAPVSSPSTPDGPTTIDGPAAEEVIVPVLASSRRIPSYSTCTPAVAPRITPAFAIVSATEPRKPPTNTPGPSADSITPPA